MNPQLSRAFLSLLTIIVLLSCGNNREKVPVTVKPVADSATIHNDRLLPPDMVSTGDYAFFADSVLHGYKDVVKYYFKKYIADTCNHFHTNKKDIAAYFEGIHYAGDINHNGIPDSVFVLEPISYCRFAGEEEYEGDAYYFTDTTLPRLQTGSECCHPQNLFLVGDIDEDGVSEVGLFYSSCASHYKSLRIYSLKNNHWKEIGSSTFDLFYMDTEKPFSSWVRKTGKNTFEMLQVTDLTELQKKGKKDWLKFSMK